MPVINPVGFKSGSPSILLNKIPFFSQNTPELAPLLMVAETEKPNESVMDKCSVFPSIDY